MFNLEPKQAAPGWPGLPALRIVSSWGPGLQAVGWVCPLGGFSRMHPGGVMPVLRARCGLSVLCDALPEREPTAL